MSSRSFLFSTELTKRVSTYEEGSVQVKYLCVFRSIHAIGVEVGVSSSIIHAVCGSYGEMCFEVLELRNADELARSSNCAYLS